MAISFPFCYVWCCGNFILTHLKTNCYLFFFNCNTSIVILQIKTKNLKKHLDKSFFFVYNNRACGSGGTGRRARLRGVWFYRTGSIPVSRTRKRLRIGNNSESFSTKSTLSGGINRMHDEIPLSWDEIRLDGGWVDLISSEAKG